MRRTALGLIALALVGGGLLGLYGSGSAGGESDAASSVALRAGVLLGAIWLALPQLAQLFRRFPPWLLGSAGLCLVLLVVRPKLIIYVVPLLLLLALLQFVSRLFRPLK